MRWLILAAVLICSQAQAQTLNLLGAGSAAKVAVVPGLTFPALIGGYIANRYYAPLISPATTGAAVTASTIYCNYAYFPTNVTFLNIGVSVTTASAGGNVQIGIYANADGVPGALIQSSASMSTTSGAPTGVNANLGGTIQLGPTGSSGGPDVWVCSNSDNSVSAYMSTSPTSGNPPMGGNAIGATAITGLMNGSAFLPTALSCNGANCQGGASTFNSWPADLTTSTWTTESTNLSAIIVFKAVSSP